MWLNVFVTTSIIRHRYSHWVDTSVHRNWLLSLQQHLCGTIGYTLQSMLKSLDKTSYNKFQTTTFDLLTLLWTASSHTYIQWVKNGKNSTSKTKLRQYYVIDFSQNMHFFKHFSSLCALCMLLQKFKPYIPTYYLILYNILNLILEWLH